MIKFSATLLSFSVLLFVAPPAESLGYCTEAPDKDCYLHGWPQCCVVPGETCPIEKPPCNRSGGTYCTFSPNYLCYEAGWPACCEMDEGADCPSDPPACDTPGGNYCTDAPDHGCYIGGWPVCCLDTRDFDCPTDKPGCDHLIGDAEDTGSPSSPPGDSPTDAPTTSGSSRLMVAGVSLATLLSMAVIFGSV